MLNQEQEDCESRGTLECLLRTSHGVIAERDRHLWSFSGLPLAASEQVGAMRSLCCLPEAAAAGLQRGPVPLGSSTISLQGVQNDVSLMPVSGHFRLSQAVRGRIRRASQQLGPAARTASLRAGMLTRMPVAFQRNAPATVLMIPGVQLAGESLFLSRCLAATRATPRAHPAHRAARRRGN